MKRLDEQQRNLIKELAEKGFSINYIVKKTNLSKSVVYYWFRKTVGKKTRTVKICDKLEEEIGEIIGIFAGDGNFYLDSNYKYRIRFYFSGNQLNGAKKLNKLLKQVYGKDGNITSYGNVIIVNIYGKPIIEHIKKFLEWKGGKTYSVRLKNIPSKHSLDFLKGFCRGLINAEGWVLKNNLMIACVSEPLIENLSDSLSILKIPHLKTKWESKDNRRWTRHVIFFNKENMLIFFNRVGCIKSNAPGGI